MNDLSARIRTGIIGYGLAGRVFHSPFVATNNRFSLDVIATGDPSRQAEARAQHPGVEIVTTPEELIASDLDLVVLASPPHVHLQQGLAALERGAAVVVDKPFAASVAQASALIAAGGQLFVFQNRRWDGDFLTVKKLVASGALGRVHRFESTFERWAPALKDRWQDTTPVSDGAGITFDLGSHLVDQALQLFGPATLVDAELTVVRDGGVSEDDAFLALRHDTGVHSHLTLSRVAGQIGPRFRVLGTESAYLSYGLDGQEPALAAGGSPIDPGFGETPESRWGTLGTGTDVVPVPTERGDYAAFYRGVAAAMLDGADSPVDVRDSLAALRILEQAHSF